MSLNIGIATILMDAGVVAAIGAWFYGAYHMLATFTYFYVDSDADRKRRQFHVRKLQRAGALFLGLVFLILLVAVLGRLD